MRVETREERRERRKKEKAEETAYQLEQAIALWDPANNPSATADPFKTLFIARINYETSEGKLRREFEQYGAIKQVRVQPLPSAQFRSVMTFRSNCVSSTIYLQTVSFYRSP